MAQASPVQGGDRRWYLPSQGWNATFTSSSHHFAFHTQHKTPALCRDIFCLVFSFKPETVLYQGCRSGMVLALEGLMGQCGRVAIRYTILPLPPSPLPCHSRVFWPYLWLMGQDVTVILQRWSLTRLSLISWGVWMSSLLRCQAMLFSLTPRRITVGAVLRHLPESTHGLHYKVTYLV